MFKLGFQIIAQRNNKCCQVQREILERSESIPKSKHKTENFDVIFF